jgi:WD40 repeat protein
MLVFTAYDGPAYAVAFTPDGRHLVTGGAGPIKVWSPDGPAVTAEIPAGDAAGGHLAVSPDGRYLAAVGVTVRVWDFAGREYPLARVPQYGMRSIAFAPDGSVLAAQGASEQPLVRWAIPTGEQLPAGWGGTRTSNKDKQFPTECVAYSPDGAVLATTFGVLSADKKQFDSVVFLWDAATGDPRGELRGTFTHAHPSAIAFSPDGTTLAAICGPTVLTFDVPSRKQLAKVKPGTKHLKGLAFFPDGRRLVTVSNDKSARVWDARTLAEAGGYEWKVGKLLAVAVAPDGLRVAAASGTGKVVVWDAEG